MVLIFFVSIMYYVFINISIMFNLGVKQNMLGK